MTSYPRKIQLVCACCGNTFSATRKDARFCSRTCLDEAYLHKKHLQKMEVQKAKLSAEKKKRAHIRVPIPQAENTSPTHHLSITGKELIDLPTLCYVTTISRSAMYRLLDDPEFPKIKVRGSIRFHKESAIAYILRKYSIKLSLSQVMDKSKCVNKPSRKCRKP